MLAATVFFPYELVSINKEKTKQKGVLNNAKIL